MLYAENIKSPTCVARFAWRRRLLGASWLLGAGWLLAAGCVGFDDYPEADLCSNAVRDTDGRPLHFPEARICPRVLSDGDASDAGDGGDGR